MDSVNQFIEQLLKDKGLPELDESVHQQLVSDLSTRLVDFINRRLINAMDDESVKQFNELLEREPVDPAAVQEFISTHVPNKVQVTADAMAEFRALYIGETA